jgi:hypothetical protein
MRLRRSRMSMVTRVYGRQGYSVGGVAQSWTLAWSAPAEICEAATRGDRLTQHALVALLAQVAW